MKNKQFIRFVTKASKFLIIVIAIDFLLGSVAEYLFFRQKSGKFARITYALREVEADVIILGSSHAHRHFVPSVLEQKLGMSFYNAGVQGQELLFNTVMAEIVLNRTKPKILIVNIDPYWMFESKTPYDRLSDLNPYYGEYPDIIKPIIDLKSPIEHYKNLSKAYRFNSTIVHIIKYYLSPQPDEKGFRPLGGKMSPEALRSASETEFRESMNKRKLDPNCVNAFEKLLSMAKEKNINLILVGSPHISGSWVKNNSSGLMEKIIRKHDIPYIDLTCCKNFTNHCELFNNPSHLNKAGALLFSSILADSLNRRSLKNIFARSNVLLQNQ